MITAQSVPPMATGKRGKLAKALVTEAVPWGALRASSAVRGQCGVETVAKITKMVIKRPRLRWGCVVLISFQSLLLTGF